ncbi:hypothetical protein [Streptomyces sp. B1-3]|uniref:hypothetical protein n=1 Tax=Streptomyces sp. B1-3 TaxID=3141453 RepID=UPI003D2E619D
MSSNRTDAVARRQRAITKALKKALHECVNGCGRGKAGDRYCTECGTALPIFGGAAKSAPAPALPAPAPVTDPLWFGHRNDHDSDPAVREAAWQQAFNSLVSKSQTPTAASAPLVGDPNSPNPAERERAWQQAYNHATKGR